MDREIIDSHIHFACCRRFPELLVYRRELAAERLGIVSLPSERRVNFNPEVLFAKLRLPDTCYGFASFDYSALWCGEPEALDLASQVETAFLMGFDGIKMWEGKPTFQELTGLTLVDPVFAPAFETAARRQLPIVVHVADPPQFWRADADSEARVGWSESLDRRRALAALPTFENLQQQAETIVRRHPGCTFIFPHLLFRTGNLSDFSQFMRAYPNAYLDLSPGLYYYGDLHEKRNAAREFLAEFSARILFGSDAMWFCPSITQLPQWGVRENLDRARFLLAFLESDEELDNPFELTRASIPAVRGLGLPRETLEDFLHLTFERLFDHAPRPLDRASVIGYLHDFKDSLTRLSHAGESPEKRSLDSRHFDEIDEVEEAFEGRR